MNTKQKLIRLTLLAASSSLLWVGCASDMGSRNVSEGPVNLLDQRANTFPAQTTGLEKYGRFNTVAEVPNPIINEAAGANRPR